jgi:hypothetical protein
MATFCAACGATARPFMRTEPPPVPINPYAPPNPKHSSLDDNNEPVDLANLKFDPNRKRNNAALQAAQGLRLIPIAILLNLLASVTSVFAAAADSHMVPGSTNVFVLPAFVLFVAAFATGAYGIYSTMDGLGWAGYVSFLLIVSLLIPYLGFVTLLVVAIRTLIVMQQAGYRFTLLGKIKKTA